MLTYIARAAAFVKVQTHPLGKPAPMKPLDPVRSFNKRVHVDLLGKLQLCQGATYLMVLQDSFSKWIELVPLPDKTGESTAQALLDRQIYMHGKMKTLVSDLGCEFINHIMKHLCDKLKINHQITSASHPQSNGLVE